MNKNKKGVCLFICWFESKNRKEMGRDVLFEEEKYWEGEMLLLLLLFVFY